MGQEGYNKVSQKNTKSVVLMSYPMHAVPRVIFQSAHDVSMDGRGVWNTLY